VNGWCHMVASSIMKVLGVQTRLGMLGLLRTWKSFLIQISTDVVINVSAVSGALIIGSRFGGIGNWGPNQILFLVCYTLAINVFVSALFSQNFASLSRRIGRGQMDHALLTPRSLPFQLLYEGFNPLGQPLMLPFAIISFFVSAIRVVGMPSILWWICAAISVFSSVAIVMAFQVAVGAAAFWDPYAGEEVSSAANRLTLGLASYPMDGVTGVFYLAVIHVIPIASVAWQPVSGLIRGSPSWVLLSAPATAVVATFIACVVFMKGMKRYERVGAIRYSSSGFRR